MDLPYSDPDALNITQVSLHCCETRNVHLRMQHVHSNVA